MVDKENVKKYEVFKIIPPFHGCRPTNTTNRHKKLSKIRINKNCRAKKEINEYIDH